MEFLYDRFVEWMRQRLIESILTSLLRHIVTLALSMMVAVTVSTLAVRFMMPVERARMFMVPRDSLPSDGNMPVYYGFLNEGQSPTAGFPYKAQLVFRCRPPSTTVGQGKHVFKGKARLTLRSSSGIAVVDKSAGFKVVSSAGDVTAAAEAVAVTASSDEFPVGKLLAPIHDGNVRLLFDDDDDDREEREGRVTFAHHIEIKLSLDCSGDMYARLLCHRTTRWAVIGWTWAALYSAVMAVTTSFLLATKVMNLLLAEFVRTILRWASAKVRGARSRAINLIGCRGRRQPERRRIIAGETNGREPLLAETAAVAEDAEESIDALLATIKAASSAVTPSKQLEEQRENAQPLPTIIIDTSMLAEEAVTDEYVNEETGNDDTDLEAVNSAEAGRTVVASGPPSTGAETLSSHKVVSVEKQDAQKASQAKDTSSEAKGNRGEDPSAARRPLTQTEANGDAPSSDVNAERGRCEHTPPKEADTKGTGTGMEDNSGQDGHSTDNQLEIEKTLRSDAKERDEDHEVAVGPAIDAKDAEIVMDNTKEQETDRADNPAVTNGLTMSTSAKGGSTPEECDAKHVAAVAVETVQRRENTDAPLQGKSGVDKESGRPGDIVSRDDLTWESIADDARAQLANIVSLLEKAGKNLERP